MMATTQTTCLGAKHAAFAGKTVKSQASRAIAKAGPVKIVAEQLSWMPGSKHPAHLKGELPGDFGFDPLGLGKDPGALAWYVQAELVHARFAMLGTAGILIPEALTKVGILNVPVWFKAGASDFAIANFNSLLVVQLILMGWVETKRYMDYKNPTSQGAEGSFLGFEAFLGGTGQNGYPGAAFDPLGLASDAEKAKELKIKEIKNGRLAMMAMLGFYGQAVATGKGPVENWVDHLADPFHTTVASNSVAVPFL